MQSIFIPLDYTLSPPPSSWTTSFMNSSISHLEPSCLALLYTCFRNPYDYIDSQNLRILEINSFKDLILQKGKLRPREGMYLVHSILVVFFMKYKPIEDRNRTSPYISYTCLPLPPNTHKRYTCTQHWTQYSTQIKQTVTCSVTLTTGCQLILLNCQSNSVWSNFWMRSQRPRDRTWLVPGHIVRKRPRQD